MGRSKSKSTSTNNTTNVSGQNAIDGDNLGVALSGVNNSTINANMTMTAHGAIDAALALGEEAFHLGGEMIASNERVPLEAMDMNRDMAETAIDEVADFAGASLKTYASTNSENLNM